MRRIIRLSFLLALGMAVAALGMLRPSAASPGMAYGNALFVLSFCFFLLAWIWYLRADGLNFLGGAQGAGADEKTSKAEKRLKDRALMTDFFLSGGISLLVSLIFQYALP